jgi:hypothetical protein
MTEIVSLIRRQYKPRKDRLKAAVNDGATRTSKPLKSLGEKCAICTRAEHGGGLLTYQKRDGSELLVGSRCARFVDYLNLHTNNMQSLLCPS